MKRVLTLTWFIYWPAGWAIFFMSHLGFLSSVVNLGTILVGLIFYILKLRYLNDVKLVELNYLTIIFDLLLYIYLVLIGAGVWTLVYYKLNQVDPSYFIRFFGRQELFYAYASKAILVASGLFITLFIGSGVNHPYKALKFTNKVAVLEIIFVLIALGWVMININFIGMFISVIAVSTAPTFVKKAVSRIASRLLNREINLLDIKINNNSTHMIYLTTPGEHIINIFLLIITPLILLVIMHIVLIFITALLVLIPFSKHGG